jgi:hypothetical protein
MRKIAIGLVLLVALSIPSAAHAAPKPSVKLKSERGSPPAGCTNPDPSLVCVRIHVYIKNYIPNLSQTEDVQGLFATHATRNGPIEGPWNQLTAYSTDSQGNAHLQFGGIECDPAYPWFTFDLIRPVPVDSKPVKAC